MGSKPAPTESCSLRQGTPSPGYLRDNVSITSDIYIYILHPHCHFQLKRQILLKFHRAMKKKASLPLHCLLKTKDPAKSKEIHKSLLSKGFYLAIQCLEIVYHLKVSLVLSHTLIS